MSEEPAAGRTSTIAANRRRLTYIVWLIIVLLLGAAAFAFRSMLAVGSPWLALLVLAVGLFIGWRSYRSASRARHR
jgi:hypothetical protein